MVDDYGCFVFFEIFFYYCECMMVVVLYVCCELFSAGEFECVSCVGGNEAVKGVLPVVDGLF